MPEAAPVTWETLDWDALDDLRRRFLASSPSGGSYWRSWSDLANYDLTFAQRIGWKWDAVLSELARRGWHPPRGPLLDWGCGSGIAGRRLLEFYGPAHFGRLWLEDRAPLAVRFAQQAAASKFPAAEVQPWNGSAGDFKTLVLSHVLNELDSSDRSQLAALLGRAAAVLWVEPGTYADSRALIAFRQEWLAEFTVIAPCTHQALCGMLRPHNAPHWCHHFAAPPPGLFTDGDWVRFGQRAGVDLRSIPYSFLVLARADALPPEPGPVTEAWSRVIGHPRMYKGYAKVLQCSREDVREVAVWQRENRALFRAFRKGKGPPLLRGTVAADDRLAVEETL